MVEFKAEVVELADTPSGGGGAERRGGSNPPFRTIISISYKPSQSVNSPLADFTATALPPHEHSQPDSFLELRDRIHPLSC
jgi:hypothetical protein